MRNAHLWRCAAGVSALIAALTGPALAAAPGPLAFAVKVSLSPKAAATLRAKHETITVAASFYGDPSPAAARHADQVGQINLGRETVEIAGAGGEALITAECVKSARLPWLTGPPQVNVNIYSSRRSGPDNLLDCAFFQDAVAVARKAPPALACKLIGER